MNISDYKIKLHNERKENSRLKQQILMMEPFFNLVSALILEHKAKRKDGDLEEQLFKPIEAMIPQIELPRNVSSKHQLYNLQKGVEKE
jgi:hypothetical protein